MNEEIAKKRAALLKNKTISGWRVGEYLGSGKTAFVCKARKGSKIAAIKIFETDSLEDKEIRELRIRLNRQLSLVDKKHPNLIKIYDGGYSDSSGCYFLIMQYIDAKPLSRVIERLPRDKIGSLITQIASAAKYLESLNLAHRDIKPDNIVVTEDYSKAVLLDLGVIRTLGKMEITDSTNSLHFVGTLRYSSPEFLFREEKDTKKGWKAVTFYQLGAVLHDMIMRYAIFQGQTEPYAKLVHAIKYEVPNLYCEDVDPTLIHLAQLCLLKDPVMRCKMLDWDDFVFPKKELNNLQEIKNRMRDRKEAISHNLPSKRDIEVKANRERLQLVYDIKSLIDKIIRDICTGNDLFPRFLIKHSEPTGDFDDFVMLSFVSSKKHSLNCNFNIYITVTIVDLSTRLIQLRCVGVLDAQIELSEAVSFLSLLFEGFADNQLFSNSIEEMLHVMLDQAQLKCSSSSSKELSCSPCIIYKFEEELKKSG